MKSLVFATALATCAAGAATAEEWTTQITPYAWAAGMGGTLTPYRGAPSLSFDKSFSDVMEDLDAAFFLSGSARRDRLVILGDFSWSSSSRAGRLDSGIPAEGELTQRSVTLTAGYRAIQNDRMSLDVLAGMRAWKLKASVSVAGGAISASHTETFVDPIIAARARFDLSPRWSAVFYYDRGGFGVGSESTSQAVVTANYRVNDRLGIAAGYRRLDVDYRSGGTRMDVTMSGPVVSLSWRF